MVNSWARWYTLLIPACRWQRQGSLWTWGFPGLQFPGARDMWTDPVSKQKQFITNCYDYWTCVYRISMCECEHVCTMVGMSEDCLWRLVLFRTLGYVWWIELRSSDSCDKHFYLLSYLVKLEREQQSVFFFVLFLVWDKVSCSWWISWLWSWVMLNFCSYFWSSWDSRHVCHEPRFRSLYRIEPMTFGLLGRYSTHQATS